MTTKRQRATERSWFTFLALALATFVAGGVALRAACNEYRAEIEPALTRP